MQMLVHLMLSQRSLRLSSFLFILFSIFCLVEVVSTILSSSSFIYSSASVILLLIPSNILFISVCFFFSYSKSLVNISCIFSIFASILFQRSWIIFTIIIMDYFSRSFLYPFNFVVFLGFCLVPSSGTKLFAFTSWLTFCGVVLVLAAAVVCGSSCFFCLLLHVIHFKSLVKLRNNKIK